MPAKPQPRTEQYVAPRLLMADRNSLPLYLRQDRVQIVQRDPLAVAELVQRADQINVRVAGGVAVIPIHGVIEYKLSLWGWLYGGTSCQAIVRATQQAIADPEITRIVYDVDSPGGTTSGIPEAAKIIFDSRGQIDTAAIANPLAASAALRLATAAARFTGLGSGEVGSVGTVAVIESWSRFYEELGVDFRVIRNPAWKFEGSEVEPISDEYAADLQVWVDRLTTEFHAELAKHRGVTAAKVRSDFGQGRTMMVSDAVAAGLCDGISSLEAEISRGNKRASTRRQEAVSVASGALAAARRAV